MKYEDGVLSCKVKFFSFEVIIAVINQGEIQKFKLSMTEHFLYQILILFCFILFVFEC